MNLLFKTFVLFATIAIGLDTFAHDCEIDGVYYNLNTSDQTASVTFKAYKKNYKPSYKGVVIIPEHITYKKKRYTVTSIGKSAFASCSDLTQITIPQSVTKIDDYAVFACFSITQIAIPESVKEIGKDAFEYCESLTHVNIPASVTVINPYTFSNCRSLKQVEIPESVSKISKFAFFGSGLTSVCIPCSVAEIEDNAFNLSNGLKTVTVLNPVIKGLESAIGGVEELIIPDVMEINEKVFANSKITRLSELKLRSGCTLAEYTKMLPFEDWESYYQKRHTVAPYNFDASVIGTSISADIEKWQKKGEFESTAAWKERVNERTRRQRIDSIKSDYTDEARYVNKVYTEEYNRLQIEYEAAYNKHYKDVVDKYYGYHTEQAKMKFLEQSISLNAPYDADNQSFLINTSSVGDILLPVPLSDAPSFKSDWNAICKGIRPVFVPDGDGVSLNKVIFYHNGKEYVYDSRTEAKYAVTDINYNFAPVEISDIDIEGIDIAVNNLPEMPAMQTIGKHAANDAISVKKVAPERKLVSAGSSNGKSDVDRNIPVAGRINERTFALVVANENYRREVSVPFAANDGIVFAQYLKKTLGLPDENIQLVVDGSLNDLKFGLNKLSKICGAFPGEASIIVYYAGHGVPDEDSKDAYLLPVDGYGSDMSTGLSLRELYALLGEMPSKHTTVFLDACFSGAVRSGDMMMSARGVRIKPAQPIVGGNMVVFSATMDDETAYPYYSENHGMFTFFLLKKLQDTKGDVTLGTLADYIITKVKQTSILKNDIIQTPTVTASPLAPDWQNVRL